MLRFIKGKLWLLVVVLNVFLFFNWIIIFGFVIICKSEKYYLKKVGNEWNNSNYIFIKLGLDLLWVNF